jgi:hypothetical protein
MLIPLRQITNFEMGIVFSLKDANEADTIACWERPARKYAIGKDVPWVCGLTCRLSCTDSRRPQLIVLSSDARRVEGIQLKEHSDVRRRAQAGFAFWTSAFSALVTMASCTMTSVGSFLHRHIVTMVNMDT